VLEVGVRAVQARRDVTRDLLDLRGELLVGVKRHVRRSREQLDRAVVVGRAEPARDDKQLVRETFAERRFEIGRLVTDNCDARRVDAEPQQRRCEERPVAILPVAAHELGARRDDRRS